MCLSCQIPDTIKVLNCCELLWTASNQQWANGYCGKCLVLQGRPWLLGWPYVDAWFVSRRRQLTWALPAYLLKLDTHCYAGSPESLTLVSHWEREQSVPTSCPVFPTASSDSSAWVSMTAEAQNSLSVCHCCAFSSQGKELLPNVPLGMGWKRVLRNVFTSTGIFLKPMLIMKCCIPL